MVLVWQIQDTWAIVIVSLENGHGKSSGAGVVFSNPISITILDLYLSQYVCIYIYTHIYMHVWLILKFRRVTIRGAQPSARPSEEICLSEGSAWVSQRALRGLSEGSAGSLRGSA